MTGGSWAGLRAVARTSPTRVCSARAHCSAVWRRSSRCGASSIRLARVFSAGAVRCAWKSPTACASRVVIAASSECGVVGGAIGGSFGVVGGAGAVTGSVRTVWAGGSVVAGGSVPFGVAGVTGASCTVAGGWNSRADTCRQMKSAAKPKMMATTAAMPRNARGSFDDRRAGTPVPAAARRTPSPVDAAAAPAAAPTTAAGAAAAGREPLSGLAWAPVN